MALILIRADSQEKLLNAIADTERHAKLKIRGKPRIIDATKADNIVKDIIKQNIRSKSKIAAILMVEEDSTKSIMHIKKIHPPAHLIVISNEYAAFNDIKKLYATAPVLKGYYSHKKMKN